MSDYRFVTYETLEEGRIARIMMNRPKQRNAQNRGLLVELNDAFLKAEADDEVRVVILGGVGPAFSAGHDLGSSDARAERAPGPDQHYTMQAYGGTKVGAEQRTLQEWHFFFDNTRRWRNLRKITIAQVQGNCLAAGLMLAWCCDLIVAAEDAVFADVVGTRLGMCGLEYFAHPWEFGVRKTKELMLTGDSIDAEEAYRLGMVSKVFKLDELEQQTLAFAEPDREPAVDDLAHDQGVGERDAGQPGLLQRAERMLHAPPAEPRPLVRGEQGRDRRSASGGRHPPLARGAAGEAGGEDHGRGDRLEDVGRRSRTLAASAASRSAASPRSGRGSRPR